MLKPKSSQSSGCTHIHLRGWKSLNKRLSEGWWQLFSGTGKECWWWYWCNKGPQCQKCTVKHQKKSVGLAIQNKRCGLLASGVVLRDNACPATAACTWELLEHFSSELFDHPPYSRDLTLSNYHLLTYLKNWLGSQHFTVISWWKVWKCSWAYRQQAYKNLFPDMTSASIPAVTTLKVG
jgi:hypothetical protein